MGIFLELSIKLIHFSVSFCFFFVFFLILGLKCSHKLKYKKKEIGNST
jgi:hypothetical protein